jgi:hypothetical protein
MFARKAELVSYFQCLSTVRTAGPNKLQYVLQDTCFLFGFPNVFGNKEGLCLNYLGYIPCIPRSFLMFLYICFDINSEKMYSLSIVARRRI